MLCPTPGVLLDCFSNVFYALAHVSIDPTAEHSKPAFNFKLGHYRKVSKCARCGATFTLERTRGTFRTLAISVSALFHFNFDSF